MNTSSVSADSASPPEQPKRRLLIQMGLWGLVLLAAGLVSLVSWYRHRQVTVSPQTTYATQPLTPQGLPDYAAWYRQQHESPASPEENALVLLLRAHGRKGFSLSMLQELCDRLGIEVPPESSAGFVPLPEELHRRIGHEEPRWGERIFQLQETELARLARWLEQNRQALALAVQASRKRRLWLPLYPQLPPRPPLAATDAAHIFAKEWTSPSWNTWIVSALIDNPFRALRLRALVHMRRGQLQQAWQDLLAAWRLAQLQAQGLTLEDSAESVQKQELLHPLALMCLRQGPPDAELALSILKQLKPSQAAFLPRQLVLLRLSTLHWVLQAHQEQALCRELAVMTSVDSWLYLEPASSPPSANRSPLVFPELSLRLSPPPEPFWFSKPPLDWDRNALLRGINQTFDEVEPLVEYPPAQLLEVLPQVALNVHAGYMGRRNWILGRLSSTKRSYVAGRVIAWEVIREQLESLLAEKIQMLQRLDLFRLAVALEGYRSRHGHYPQRLAALVPEFLEEVPLDRFTMLALSYRRTEKGYQLSSDGPFDVKLQMPPRPDESDAQKTDAQKTNVQKTDAPPP